MEYINTIPFNSFEFGKPDKRHKIYYQDVKQLTDKLMKLKMLGLIDIDLQINNFEKDIKESQKRLEEIEEDGIKKYKQT